MLRTAKLSSDSGRPHGGIVIRGFPSIHPERLAAIFAIMAILVVISATWFGQQIAAIDSAGLCDDASACASILLR